MTNQSRKRFERLLNLRQQSMMQLEYQLAELSRRERAEQAKVAQLQAALDDEMQRGIDDLSLDAVAAHDARSRSTSMLRNQTVVQLRAVNEVRNARLQVLERYAQAKAKVNSIERLLERHRDAARRQREKDDQAELDDRVLVGNVTRR